MTEEMSKGAVPNGYMKFIKRKWGVSGLEEAMKYAGIEKRPKDSEWFPMRKSDMLLEWIYRNKGEKQVIEAGRFAAKDLGIFGYLFSSILGLDRLLERSRETYPRMFNYGRMIYEKDGNRAIVIMKGVKLSEYTCLAWEGGIKGLMEITKSTANLRRIEVESDRDCKYSINGMK